MAWDAVRQRAGLVGLGSRSGCPGLLQQSLGRRFEQDQTASSHFSSAARIGVGDGGGQKARCQGVKGMQGPRAALLRSLGAGWLVLLVTKKEQETAWGSRALCCPARRSAAVVSRRLFSIRFRSFFGKKGCSVPLQLFSASFGLSAWPITGQPPRYVVLNFDLGCCRAIPVPWSKNAKSSRSS